ncbi:3426_t:CDS:10, partial [Diversispora eburnea]
MSPPSPPIHYSDFTSTPIIRIYTPPSSPPTMSATGQEEWDSVDDFSVDSLPAEDSSSTAQTTFTPSSPPEEINCEEISNETDVQKNSSTEILQKMGHWFYNTRFIQYMKSDERSRVKHVYSTNPIWMLGIEYKFIEDTGSVSFPKQDKDSRGGRASSLLNFMFGSAEEEEDYCDVPSHNRSHSDEYLKDKPDLSSSSTYIRNPEFQTNNNLQPYNIQRLSIAQNILKNINVSNHENEPTSPTNKNKLTSPPSQRLYPHLEAEGDYEQKYSIDDPRFNNTSIDGLQRKQIEVTYPENITYSSEEESDLSDIINEVDILSGDNLSVKTITRGSLPTQNDNSIHSNFEIIKDIDINKDIIISDGSQSTNKFSDTGSVKSTSSFKSLTPTPTSLYRPDSLGTLTPDQKILMDFVLDFQSRIYCSYRKDFLPIEPAFHTTDTGWGCMHRTGQSLLAQGFLWVLLGRDWRLHNFQTDSDLLIYRKILRWFMDGPEPEHYYSIHNIARAGISLDKRIGDWFGPATVAHAIKRLSLYHKECPLVIYVPTDNTIYKSEIATYALGEYESNSLFIDQRPWKPVLILFSVRLGTDKFNLSYAENLKKLFSFPQFLGIAGGRPGRSLYFVAVQDDELYYLDPHFVRPAINLNKVTEFPIEDYHSTIIRAMDISEMDPSMLLGFLCQNSNDFDNLCERFDKEMNSQYPILTILNSFPIHNSWASTKSLSESSSEKSVLDG